MFTLKREGGFSTVELLITLVVIGMVFVIFSELNTNTTSIVAKGEDATVADEVANKFLQYYETRSCASGILSIDECLENSPSEGHQISKGGVLANPNDSTHPFYENSEYLNSVNQLDGDSKVTITITDQEIGGTLQPPEALLKKVKIDVAYGKNGTRHTIKNTILGLKSKGGTH